MPTKTAVLYLLRHLHSATDRCSAVLQSRMALPNGMYSFMTHHGNTVVLIAAVVMATTI